MKNKDKFNKVFLFRNGTRFCSYQKLDFTKVFIGFDRMNNFTKHKNIIHLDELFNKEYL